MNRNFDAPDHQTSTEPKEFKVMVDSILNAEQALRSRGKAPVPMENENRKIIRKSLVAAYDVLKGEVFSEKNIAFKRPAECLPPMRFWDTLRKKASRSFPTDGPISL